jgi:short-subunit dehydrogenase
VKRNLTGSRGIVTGASSGIGLELAEQLGQAGARLLLVARRETELQQLTARLRSSGCDAHYLTGDVTAADIRRQAIGMAEERFGGLDFLVNNAGVGALGRFEDATAERLRSVMEVNFFAAVELTRAALSLLRRGNRPIIVNIGSILGHVGIPHSSEYCASKFALRGFTQSIRSEFARHGIDVLLVSPGTTQTDFFRHALENKQVPWPEQRGVSPETVARRTIRAMRRGQQEIIVNPRGKALVLLHRLAPSLVHRMLRRYG